MKTVTDTKSPDTDWLKTYYYLRFVVSAIWVALAFTIAKAMPQLAAAMLITYPAWDALANYLDASRSGGLAKNKTQMLNFLVSVGTAVAVSATLPHGPHAVLQIFGVWAVLSGFFQLLTAARRWKSYGAQWAMILSGAQSGLAGAHMLSKAAGPAPVSIVDIAPYAAFGAFYFLISAVSLTISEARRRSKAVPA
jgi:uncharacterized membrane protein HdeD (DUF308 family)